MLHLSLDFRPYSRCIRSLGAGCPNTLNSYIRVRVTSDRVTHTFQYELKVDNAERQRHDRSSCAPQERTGGQSACRRDRKSTRLNSSHVAISYAVFCLKKKNYTVWRSA